MQTPWHVTTETVAIRKITVGPYENNVYVVACRATRQAVIVDAAAEPDRIVEACAGTTPIGVLTTHGHHDHVGAATAVTTSLGIPFRMHVADTEIAGLAPEPIDPGPIPVGDIVVEAIHTPGHTPGSTCFLVDGAILTGDTLFPGGPGATRFPYSNFELIIGGISALYDRLDDELLVLPGHGLDTTIGTERPHLEEWVERGW